MGGAIKDLITIVTPRTFARWVSGEATKTISTCRRRPGRPRTPEEVREIILASPAKPGGAITRILAELKKLGIRNAGRTTVRKILSEAGFDPGSLRGEGTWDEFLKIHANTLWASDFLSKKVWRWAGWRATTCCFPSIPKPERSS